MINFILRFTERVFTGITSLLVAGALVAGLSQNLLADPILPPGPVMSCLDPLGTNCAVCGPCDTGGCGVGNLCISSCTATGGNCPDCTCQIPDGQTQCGCYK